MDILEDNDFFKPTQRIKFEEGEGKDWYETQFSIAADATPEEIEAAKQVCRDISAKIVAFKQLPEADRLKYYLANALQALLKINNETFINLTDDFMAIPPKYRAMISSASSVADMAIIGIPTQYRETDIVL